MDSFEQFLNRSLSSKQPFLACIHFHNVHIPYVATGPFRALYPGATSNEKDYWGGLSMMDAQIGRLRALLKRQGVAEHTAVFFGTDNGPEVGAPSDPEKPGVFPVAGWPYFPDPGVTGPPTRDGGRLPFLRGRKRDLTEGGIRVPGLVEWPELIDSGSGGRAAHWPSATFDYLPTVLATLGVASDNPAWPLDGIDLRPLLSGKLHTRSAAAAAAAGGKSGAAGIGAMGWEFKT